LHGEIAEFVAVDQKRQVPKCWSATQKSEEVAFNSDEYNAVTGYFLHTLALKGTVIKQLTRLQNYSVYNRFRRQGGETFMFHGCRSAANETAILEDGFKVSKCTSGGHNFGTWFAYGAHYSNSGYVFVDPSNTRHIFLCAVSYAHTVLDNQTMRVVGQDCAVPLWLIEYTLPPPVYRPTPARSFMPRSKKRQPNGSSPEVFYVVRDGRWVQEMPKESK